jgi:hypothetical protein
MQFVGTDTQKRGHCTTLMCGVLIWPALDAERMTTFVNPVEGHLYVSLLFEGELEISTVLWSGLYNQFVTSLLI